MNVVYEWDVQWNSHLLNTNFPGENEVAFVGDIMSEVRFVWG